MKNRLIGLFLAIALMLSCIPGVFAEETKPYTDIEGNSAEAAIEWAYASGLYSVPEDRLFHPEEKLTRSMLVTVLGRMASISEDQYLDWYTGLIYEDVSAEAYYGAYVAWATQLGIMRGTTDYRFSPDMNVNREQLATILMRYLSIYNLQLCGLRNAVDSFADADRVAAYASASVESLRIAGILRGTEAESGKVMLRPKQAVSRAEFSQILYDFCSALQPYSDRELVDATEIRLSQDTADLWVGQRLRLGAQISPEETTNKTLTWVSSDPAVVKVNLDGVVTATGEGSAQVFCFTTNGIYQSCTVQCTFNPSLSSADETYAERCIRLFGEVTADPRNYYQSPEEAESHMVNIAVRVWDFTDDTRTEKTTKILWLQVHENLATTFQAIFEEIYNGEEQFPIKAVGCYRGQADSEHYSGCAVDINPYENYECTADGVPMTGYYWKPGEDEYSIPLDGDVAKAFAHYGFTQGAYWRYTRDYMHFSYFAT